MIEPDAEEEELPRERRLSRPIRTLAALLLILLAWGTLWLARPRTAGPPTTTSSTSVAPVPSQPGDVPLRVGTRYLCTRGEQIRAFDWLGMSYFPTNHPFAPLPTVLPTRCFRTSADAEEAGYVLGGITEGAGALVSGIYLVHPNEELTNSCLGLANQLGFPVPCPDLLPWPGRELRVSDCSYDQAIDLCTYLGAFSLVVDRFATPVGHQAAHSNLVVLAFKRGAFNGGLACSNGTRVGTALVKLRNDEELTADLIDCPLDAVDLLLAGHLMLRWKFLGVTYEVGVEGNFDDTQALLEAIASNLRLIAPA